MSQTTSATGNSQDPIEENACKNLEELPPKNNDGDPIGENDNNAVPSTTDQQLRSEADEELKRRQLYHASSGGNPLIIDDDDFRKFHILDEISDEENEEIMSDDSDVPDDEIETMLEESYSRKRKAGEAGLDDANPHRFAEMDKIVLIEKDKSHLNMLPEGWMQVTHNSGMPVYLNKISRVCTLSRPYFLGPGSVRKHEIPISAIPCLSYRTSVEKEKLAEQKETITNPQTPNLPETRIETVQESDESLNPVQLREYCSKVFQFKTIKVTRFNSWLERRQHMKRNKQRPMLPEDTKLITLKNDANMKKEWILNPNGKSNICILHEYVQHALRKQPSYEFQELENAATPYKAQVFIDSMNYGFGLGTSKKQAKSEAARAALEVLIPEIKDKTKNTSKENKYSFFDEVNIEDPRIAEFCAKTTEPSPYDILLTCLQRNFELEQPKIDYCGSISKQQVNEFTMTVGKHKATVTCRNKREGKQQASQAILKALHPHITSWGSILRLYGNRSVKSFKEKKLEEQEVTSLQSKAASNSPNYAILNKLRAELLKLGEKRKALKPIGVFVHPQQQTLPKLSASNLNNVDLK